MQNNEFFNKDDCDLLEATHFENEQEGAYKALQTEADEAYEQSNAMNANASIKEPSTLPHPMAQAMSEDDSDDALDAEAATDESEAAETLSIVRHYLAERCELRNNVVSGQLEFRSRGEKAPFRQLTTEAENSIVIDAMMALGKLKGLKTNLMLLIHSEEVKDYDPVREYLTTLPHWDGKNRVVELFGRLPDISAENIYRCTIWLRSAVAHWLRMDPMHGNDAVPTLIGDQGCGKTVFCRRLLPPALQTYFLDRMNLSNKFDKDMALTNNMIVVLDEFDQYTTSQQASLKQALSRSTVNARQIYHANQVVRHRYASFLATTNNLRPLNDPTGSRRYVCIRLAHGALIDNDAPIDYDQLYAQVVDEVCERKMRYWFTQEETQQIMMDNVPFQREVDIDEMLDACFVKPQSADQGRELTINEIVEHIVMRYPYLTCNMALKMKLGGALKRRGFVQRRHNSGNSYIVVLKRAA